MRRWATGLLATTSGVWVALRLLQPAGGWVGYAQAGLEASMVGGLADWFAVTALFRRPLGLPIPHTAVVVERKDQFGKTLAEFFRENFLSGEAVAERIRTSSAVSRLASWAAEPSNAQAAARHILRHVSDVLDATGDQVAGVLVEEARHLVGEAPLAPLIATSLRAASSSTLFDAALDAGIDSAARVLSARRTELLDRFMREGPWWLPDPVQRRLFDQLLRRALEQLTEVRADAAHPLRDDMRDSLAEFAERIECDPEIANGVEKLKGSFVDDERVAAAFTTFFTDGMAKFHQGVRTPGSRVEHRLVEAIAGFGQRVRDTASAQAAIEQAAETGVSRAVEIFRDDIDALVTGTIARWDAQRTADQLELLLGSDLQFIRINGTIVGGLAGLAIHALGRLMA